MRSDFATTALVVVCITLHATSSGAADRVRLIFEDKGEAAFEFGRKATDNCLNEVAQTLSERFLGIQGLQYWAPDLGSIATAETGSLSFDDIVIATVDGSIGGNLLCYYDSKTDNPVEIIMNFPRGLMPNTDFLSFRVFKGREKTPRIRSIQWTPQP